MIKGRLAIAVSTSISNHLLHLIQDCSACDTSLELSSLREQNERGPVQSSFERFFEIHQQTPNRESGVAISPQGLHFQES